MVITALTEDRIDPKLAALLFYGLQVASTNAHKLNPVPKRDPGKVSPPYSTRPTATSSLPKATPKTPRTLRTTNAKPAALASANG